MHMNKNTKRSVCHLSSTALFILCLIGICVSMTRSDEQPSPDSQRKLVSPREYIRSFSRKVDIPIASASSGVNSGLVIAYGHPIPPPYKFDRRGTILYLNNVEVDPSLVRQREHDEMLKNKPPVTAAVTQDYLELEKFTSSLRREYFDKQGKEPDDQLHAEILAKLQANPLIREAHWENSVEIVYKDKFSGYDVPTGILFREYYLHPQPHKIWSEQAINEEMQKDIQEHEDWLKRGGCFFFTGIGPWQGQSWQCKDIKPRVVQIMSQSNLSQDEKEKQLTQLFKGDENVALDILLNYKESEWK
jgi:hypothetical protein